MFGSKCWIFLLFRVLLFNRENCRVKCSVNVIGLCFGLTEDMVWDKVRGKVNGID